MEVEVAVYKKLPPTRKAYYSLLPTLPASQTKQERPSRNWNENKIRKEKREGRRRSDENETHLVFVPRSSARIPPNGICGGSPFLRKIALPEQ